MRRRDLGKTLGLLTGLCVATLARGPLCRTQGPTKPLLSTKWCTGPKPRANCMLQGCAAPDRSQRGEGRPAGSQVTGESRKSPQVPVKHHRCDSKRLPWPAQHTGACPCNAQVPRALP